MPLQSTNPATGELLRSFPTLAEDALQQRIAQAAEAATSQRSIPLEHRALCLRKLAILLTEESAELAHTITLETGKPIRAAAAEIARCAEACRYYAENSARLLAPELLQSDGATVGGQTSGQAYVQWAPVGVVLAVMPWESPFWQALRFAIPTLMAGNTVLLKHAATVPQCALLIEALVRRAGFERGALSSLLIEDRLVETVLGDPRVAAVSVTGTETAGRAIAAQAGWLLKKSALHLPGSDRMVVMPSANVQEAVAAAARGLAAGAGKRLILTASIYNDFVDSLVATVDALRIGDPLKDDTEVGPLGTAEAVTMLAEQIEAAVTAGGRILTGGTRLVGRGNFFEPTLLGDVPRTAAVAHDALAGPVAMVFRARDLADAIALANDTPFGVGASVWTKEPNEQQQLIAGIDAGAIALNGLPGEDPRLPFGGSKRSGYGRELGSAGMREFLHAKTVSIGQSK